MSKHLVLVYGSLRDGNPGPMSVRFPNSKFIANARVNGHLYNLGAYPALQLDGSGSLVTGELYEVDDETLTSLDQFELSDDYLRKEVEVEQGTERKRCWIYVPDQDAEFFSNLKLVESGDWIEHLRSRTSPEDLKRVAGGRRPPERSTKEAGIPEGCKNFVHLLAPLRGAVEKILPIRRSALRPDLRLLSVNPSCCIHTKVTFVLSPQAYITNLRGCGRALLSNVTGWI